MPTAVYCELCTRQVVPNTRRVMVVVSESGNGLQKGRRLGAMHEDCWEKVMTAIERFRRPAPVEA